ncbi:MAG: thiamine pyrophosphate-binding protein [Hyphomicrobiales bacterium]|nr:thiamine pyrophosphate-binding protein [Hyphomicrobiales bacterium]
MNLLQACTVIEGARKDAVLVATMGAMFAFDALKAAQPRISSVPLMGGAASLGLGLAIAEPTRRIVVVDGDASLLMQLGGLTTVADRQPANFVHFVARNGAQFAGAANLATPAETCVDYAGLAAAAGYRRTYRFEDEAALASHIDEVLGGIGPTFVELRVVTPPPIPGAPLKMEIPDLQFQRMGMEARALSAWLKEHAHG